MKGFLDYEDKCYYIDLSPLWVGKSHLKIAIEITMSKSVRLIYILFSQ